MTSETERGAPEMAAPIRLLVADDHSVVRRGVRQIVEGSPDMRISCEAADGAAVIEHVRNGDCDAVILDLNMPGPGGMDVLREVRAMRPQLPVLILSVHGEGQYAARMLKAGASGYLQKESAPEELVEAIRKVCSGARYVRSGSTVEFGPERDSRELHEVLSNREFDVLRRIASGRTVSQIAVDLQLSVKTVSTYRARLLEKMGMSNNAELTHYAIKNRVVE